MTRRLLVCLVALAAMACGSSTTSGGSGSGSGTSSNPPATGSSVSFKETEYTISPATATMKAGDYTISVQNVGQFPHDLHIATSDGSEVGASSVLKANESGTFKVTLKAGTYTMWCAVDSHRSLGMQGTITVS
jgi:plastocyanin